MAINAFIGRPGTGKSYGVVAHVILAALQGGRIVITNIPLNLELIAAQEWPGKVEYIATKELEEAADWTEKTAGAIVVIDEAWRLWPSDLRDSKIEPAHREFFREHRHQVGEDGKTTEIVLVTQCLSDISPFVRRIVETTYISKKLTGVGAKNRFRVDIYEGPATLEGKKRTKVNSQFGRYKPEIYQYYQSHTKSKTGLAGMEEDADGRNSIWKNNKFRAMLMAVVLGVVIIPPLAIDAFFGMFDASQGEQEQDPAEIPQVQSDPQPVTPAEIPNLAKPAPGTAPAEEPKREPVTYYLTGKDGETQELTEAEYQSRELERQRNQPPPRPKERPRSRNWRVVGVIKSPGQWFVAVEGRTGVTRRIQGHKCDWDAWGDPVCPVSESESASFDSGPGVPAPALASSDRRWGGQDAMEQAAGPSGQF